MWEAIKKWRTYLPAVPPFFTTTSGVASLAVIVLIVNDYSTTVSAISLPTVTYIVYWSALTAMFTILARTGWRLLWQDQERLFVQTFIVGVVVGLGSAIFKLGLHHELWTAFNLVAEPLRTALFGLLVVWVAMRSNNTELSQRVSL